jgi:hypothetical protein
MYPYYFYQETIVLDPAPTQNALIFNYEDTNYVVQTINRSLLIYLIDLTSMSVNLIKSYIL